MDARVFDCPNCQAPLGIDAINTGRPQPCAQCGRPVQVEVFPALYRPAASPAQPETILEASEASCFYHPQKKAVVPCSECGRFLCALCDVPFGEQHLCPNCLQTGREKGRMHELENRRTLWDSIALSLAVLPVVLLPFWFLTPVTAPLAIGFGIYALRKPSSILRHTHVRAWSAIILGSLELAGFGIFLFFFLNEVLA